MTEAEALAREEALEERFREECAASQRAFDARNGEPPRRSQVNGPPADWRRWNALLDGVPVSSCWGFDADEGWVEVWVVERRREDGTVYRVPSEPRRRLHGTVTPVSLVEWNRLIKTRGRVEVGAGEARDEPVPGTALREEVAPAAEFVPE
jgi:hypothetical protein